MLSQNAGGTASRPATAPPSGPVTPAGPVPREGLFSARLALLAAALYNPVLLIGYLLYLYGPVNTCVAGPLCSFGSYPALAQMGLVLLGSLFLWFALYVLVLRAIEAPGRKGPVLRWLRDLARYELVRELLALYGTLFTFGLIVSYLTRRLTPVVAVMGVFGVFVCFYCVHATRERPVPAASAAPLRPIFADRFTYPSTPVVAPDPSLAAPPTTGSLPAGDDLPTMPGSYNGAPEGSGQPPIT
jgi:hypothetical protein